MPKLLLALSFLLFAAGDISPTLAQGERSQPIVIDDFENDKVGDWPSNWKFVVSENEVVPARELRGERRSFKVEREGNRTFLRGWTKGRALRISLREGVDFDWSLDSHPILEWEWRANKLPKGGREDQRSKNDVAAAVYVTFGSDWLGRPRSIKYTYSSTLPIGRVVSQGPLRVLVLSSGTDNNTGEWKKMTRDVVADYRQVFGGDPPNDPISITLWTDSDTIANAESEADFDNIKLLPSRR